MNVFPSQRNPNPPLIMIAGCISAFCAPFAIAHSLWLAIIVSLPAILWLLYCDFIMFENWRLRRLWKKTLDGELSVRVANRRALSNPEETRLILKYETWPLSFSHLNPRLLLIDGDGGRHSIALGFPFQIREFLSTLIRYSVVVLDETGKETTPLHILPSQGKIDKRSLPNSDEHPLGAYPDQQRSVRQIIESLARKEYSE